MRFFVFVLMMVATGSTAGQQIALLKYRGGGDW